jgi:hypothetical protein
MAEIKSTLDLVMERTRHLTLSPEEKQRQQEERFHKQLQGLLQKYADSALTGEAVKAEIAAMQEELAVSDAQRVLDAIAEHIDPDADNARWLDLIDVWMPAARESVTAALTEYAQHRDQVRQAADERWKGHLLNEYNIAGTALIPNGIKDATGRERLSALRLQAHTRIATICRLKG